MQRRKWKNNVISTTASCLKMSLSSTNAGTISGLLIRKTLKRCGRGRRKRENEGGDFFWNNWIVKSRVPTGFLIISTSSLNSPRLLQTGFCVCVCVWVLAWLVCVCVCVLYVRTSKTLSSLNKESESSREKKTEDERTPLENKGWDCGPIKLHRTPIP